MRDKASYAYDLMIRQPDFVDDEVFELARETAAKKKRDNPQIAKVSLVTFREGTCVQMMHVGPYDTEPTSFAAMEAFATGQGLVRREASHREIYTSDPTKCDPSKLKTVLRFTV